MIWVRHLTPNIEIVEERHDLNSAPADRAAFQRTFAEGAAISQITKRPLIRRTMLLATLPLALAPLVLLRDLGPLPQTDLRTTVWRKGLRAVTLGGLRPLTPADLSVAGSMITVIPEGYQDDQDALAKAGVILIKFEPGQLNVPTNVVGGVTVSSPNWTLATTRSSPTPRSAPTWAARSRCTSRPPTTSSARATSRRSTRRHGASVIFGPAPRPLPQLPLMVDSNGFIAAASDFTQPVGPSFWERG